METDAWQRMQDIFEQVLATPPAERGSTLDEACAGDAALRAEIESLLDHESRIDDGFLRPPSLFGGSPATETPLWAQSLIGREVGRYTVARLIAHGGMGCVFEARQKRPARSVALKVLQPGLAAESAMARFRLEPEVLGRLQHPHIAQVYEAGVHEDEHGVVPYFAMELIPDAQPIDTYAETKPLATRQRLELFAKVCDAVHHGHQKGIIHRDLKPGNILVGADGEPKVIDFGVARSTDADIMVTTQHTNVGDLIGTVHYMSPEQCDGDSAGIDTRSDVYSLGVILYELLTGEAPYDTSGTTLFSAIRMIKERPARRPGTINRRLRGDLDSILLKSLEKDPSRRYDSASDLAQDVRRHLAGEPIEARPPRLTYVAGRYIRRHMWFTATASLGLLLVIGALVSLTIQARLAATNARAEAGRVAAERAAYRGTLQSAEIALLRHDTDTAQRQLMRVDDRRRSNWEWRHLHTRTDLSIAAFAPSDDERSFQVSIDRSGHHIVRYDRNQLTVHVYRLRYRTSDDSRPALHRIATITPGALRSAIRERLPSGTFVGDEPELRLISCVMTANDRLLAMGLVQQLENSSRSAVMVYQIDSPAPRPSLSWPESGHLHTLAFHPTEPLLAVAYSTSPPDAPRRGLRLYELVSATSVDDHEAQASLVADIPTDTIIYERLAFSLDGTWLAGTSMAGQLATLWRMAELRDEHAASTPITLRGHTHNVTNLAFSNDSSLLATCAADRTVRIWDIERCTAHASADAASSIVDQDIGAVTLRGFDAVIKSLAFSSSDNHLFAGDDNSLITVWHIDTVRTTADSARSITVEKTNTLLGHQSAIQHVRGLPEERVFSGAKSGDVRIWDPFVHEIPYLRGHRTSVDAVACAPDGRTLISGGGGYSLMLWDQQSFAPLARIDHPADTGVRQIVSWQTDGSQYCAVAFCGAYDAIHGCVAIWQIDERRIPRLVTELPRQGHDSHTRRFLSLAISADRQKLAAGDHAGQVDIFSLDGDIAQARLIRQIDAETARGIGALAFLDPAGRWLVTCAFNDDVKVTSRDRVPGPGIRMWDVDTGQEMTTAITRTESPSIRSCAVDATSEQLAVVYKTGPVDVFSIDWSGLAPNLLASRELLGHVGSTFNVQFHPTEPRMLTCGEDQVVRVWNTNDMSELVALHGPTALLTSLAISPDGRTVFSACAGSLGAENVVAAWQTETTADQRRLRSLMTQYHDRVVLAARSFRGLLDELPDYLARRAEAESWPDEVLAAARAGWALACMDHPITRSGRQLFDPAWQILNDENRPPRDYQRVRAHAERLMHMFPWRPEAHELLAAARERAAHPARGHTTVP